MDAPSYDNAKYSLFLFDAIRYFEVKSLPILPSQQSDFCCPLPLRPSQVWEEKRKKQEISKKEIEEEDEEDEKESFVLSLLLLLSFAKWLLASS